MTSFTSATDDEIRSIPSGSVADVAAVAALCNDAKILGRDEVNFNDSKQTRKIKGTTDSEKQYERVGEPTEGEILFN